MNDYELTNRLTMCNPKNLCFEICNNLYIHYLKVNEYHSLWNLFLIARKQLPSLTHKQMQTLLCYYYLQMPQS